MSSQNLLRAILGLTTLNLSITGFAHYNLRDHHVYNLEEHEARMDELEGTLRGHIGYIEEALDRLEGKATEADRGKKIDDYYGKRGRDEKKKWCVREVLGFEMGLVRRYLKGMSLWTFQQIARILCVRHVNSRAHNLWSSAGPDQPNEPPFFAGATRNRSWPCTRRVQTDIKG
jgi:hypothetical protein